MRGGEVVTTGEREGRTCSVWGVRERRGRECCRSAVRAATVDSAGCVVDMAEGVGGRFSLQHLRVQWPVVQIQPAAVKSSLQQTIRCSPGLADLHV